MSADERTSRAPATAVAGAPEGRVFANYVGGGWREPASDGGYTKRNPARLADVIGAVPASTEADADAAVKAAAAAFPAWSRLPAAERGAVLTRAAQALESRLEAVALAMAREVGKPIREGRVEVARSAQILRFFAGEAWRPLGESYASAAPEGALYTRRRPLGVVALITPWNFPLAIPVWKAAPALVFGNAVVLKPAHDSPLTTLHLTECLVEAGVPEGAFNVVMGPGSVVGRALVEHWGVRAISFTGSVQVGETVREEATRRGKRVQLELGGHNPLIVMADAPLAPAVEAAFAGAYWSAGQKCTATRRMYVQEEVYDEFKRRLLDRIDRAAVGDPTEPDVEVGPIVNEQQLDGVLTAVDEARREGGSLLAGGRRLDGDSYLVAPTLFEHVGDDATISCREVFGPVAALYPFATLDEALARANAVPYGLCAAIYTSDLRAVHRFVEEVEAGVLKVNQQTAGADVHVPFGGLKASGWGPHEQGRSAREFYTDVVTVYEDVLGA